MANVIRIKRRLTGVSGAPSALSNAELAFNEINNTLYYGKGDDGLGNATSVIAIAGDGTFATKTYVDSAVAASSPVGAAYLAQNNTFDAANTNTFNGTVNLEGVFQIDAVTVNTSAAELNVLDGVTAGTVSASKAIVVDAFSNITAFKTVGAESLRLDAGNGAAQIQLYDSVSVKTFEVTEEGNISGNSLTTVANAAVGGSLTVTGDLTVNGTTTTVNSTVVTVDDPLITVGGDTAPTADDNKDRGVAFRWHTGAAAKIGFFGYDDSSGYFTFVPDATITSEVISGTVGTINVGGVFINGSQISASALSNGVTGAGAVVLATSPTLTTPALGTPTSGTLTSCTGLPISTGVSGLGTGVATFLATPSSANLAGAVTDETGSGALVFATSPTLVTPSIGVATGTSFNSITGLSSTAPVVNGTAAAGVATTAARADHVHPTDTSRAATAGTLAQFAATTSAQLAGVISDETGTGNLVFSTSPTLVTPALGTPASGTLTSCTGLPISTGVSGLGTGVATFLATPSSANLISAVTDETGTGALVFATSPTLVTPVLGTPASGTLTSCTGLPVSTGISGLAAGVATFLATPSSANLITAVTDETGTGSLVFATSPTLITPALGTPASGTLTSCTGLPIGTGVSGLAAGVATFLATSSSANLLAAVTDETGTGVLVFGTSPTITTSIVAGSATMAVFNTTATTVNAFGAATSLSVGAATGSTTINNNLVVTGNLTINGTTTTVNSTTVTVDDPIITLGGDTAPATDDGKDRGVEFRWHNGTAAKVGFFGFDDSTGKLAFIPDATNTSEVFSGTLGTIDVGAVHISGSQIAASNLSNGVTGTGSIVLATSPAISSPTLTTPVLGTPSSGTLTSCTGLPISTGVSGLGTGVATFLATPSSANLIAAVTDETGTGALVFATSPSLTTPTLGVASATSINKVTITAPATSATITVANAKTFTCSNTLTFTGTDASSVAFGAGGTVAYLGTANAFTGANTFTNATGQTFRQAATQDGLIVQGRAGGTTSLAATLITATLTANRTITFPDETGTVVTTASVCTAVANCTLDGGTF